jgi:hypothetical protein
MPYSQLASEFQVSKYKTVYQTKSDIIGFVRSCRSIVVLVCWLNSAIVCLHEPLKSSILHVNCMRGDGVLQKKLPDTGHKKGGD